MTALSDNRNFAVDTDEINIKDYWQVLVRRRKSLFITFFIVFLTVTAYTFLMTPVWEVSSTLYLSEYQSKLPSGLDFLAPPSNSIDTEIDIVKSRVIAEEVVKKFHLNRIVSRNFLKKVKVQIGEFTSTYPSNSHPAFDIVYRGNGIYTVKDTDGNVAEGKVGDLLIGKNITLLFTDMQCETGDSFTLTLTGVYETIDNVVAKRLDAFESKKGNNILKITYDDTNVVLAKNIVQTIVDTYLRMKTEFKSEEARKSVNFISEQLTVIKENLDQADRALRDYKSSAGVFALDVEAQSLIQKVADAETQRSGAALQKKQMQFAIETLKEANKSGKAYSPFVMNDDPVVTAIAAKLTDLETQKSSLLSDYKESYPLVSNVKEQIDELQKKLLTTFDTAMKNFANQEKSYAAIIQNYNAKIRQLPAKEMELVKLMLHAKATSDIYSTLLQKQQEARLSQSSTVSSVNIIDPPIIPDTPLKPKTIIYLLIGFISGIILSFFVAFFREFLDDTIKDPEVAKHAFGLPLLVAIPYIETERHLDKKDDERDRILITDHQPKSSISEVFRSLRTSIHFTSISKRRQIILITSSFPGEGKTTIIGNFAVSLSQLGSRILLMDCDLRRPTLHTIFGHSKSSGLTDCLAGDVEFEKAVHTTGINGIDFLSAGTTPPNPVELLGSDKMHTLLERMRSKYDYILIDAPPMLAVTDAHLLARTADMIVLALQAGKVSIKVASRMRELLASIGTPIAGLVINDRSKNKMDLYGYGDKYYGYGYYGYGYGENSADGKKGRWWKRFANRLKKLVKR